MELYFIRHGIAVVREDPKVHSDEERWLTKQGISRMKKAAKGFAQLVPELDQIVTSPLVRAKETADIVAAELSKKTKVIESDVLKPSMNFDGFLSFLKEQDPNIRMALVGHEPDLSETISRLVFGKSDGQIQLGKGAICLVNIADKPNHATGTLQWLLQPKLLRRLG